RDPTAGLTVDEVELLLDKGEVHQTLPASAHEAMRNILTTLEERAGQPSLSRKLRRLEIPESVSVTYKSVTSKSDMTLQKQGDNEYAGTFADLKETIRFSAHGEDYWTPYQLITVVPPPGLVSLTATKEEPAYLHYRIPQGGTVADLKGKRQRFAERGVSLTGETSRIDIPAGTSILLTAKADKELREVTTQPRKGVPDVKPDIKLSDDRMMFQTRFDNVRSIIDVTFKLIDTDNVVGLRHV